MMRFEIWISDRVTVTLRIMEWREFGITLEPTLLSKFVDEALFPVPGDS